MLAYHATLIADEVRTRSFMDALKRVVRPGMRVLDVGTGTGVLAMTAAKLGAEVVAVEMSDMIDYARVLARANGVPIQLIHGNMRELPDDAMAPVDVVISEMIGNVLFDEKLIPIFASARRFLKPLGVMIPRRVRLVAAPVWSPMVRDALKFWRSPHHGLDWTPLADCFEHYVFLDREPHALILGPGEPFPWMDLGVAVDDRYSGEVELVVNRDGDCNAVLVWWEAELADGITLSQAPDAAWPKQHWFRTLFPTSLRAVKNGDRMPLTLVYDGTVHPDSWSWTCGGQTRSSFFAYPPNRQRRARLLVSDLSHEEIR